MRRAITAATAALLVAAVGCTDSAAPSADVDPRGTSGTTGTTGTTRAPVTSGSPTTDATPRGRTGPFGRSASLVAFGDCAALRDHLVAEASERVTAWGLGGGGWYGPIAEGTQAPAAEDTAGAAPGAGPAYSTTNTQEAGVDEGDVVETDGRSVYTVSPDALRVVDVASAAVVATVELPPGSHQLVLHGERLLVASQTWTASQDTAVSVFDVGDPGAPRLVHRSHVEGRLVAARAVDGTARLVLSSWLDARLPFVTPDEFGLDEERALERNREIIAESSVEDWLPRRFEQFADGAYGPMEPAIDCADVAAPRDFSGLGIAWIATVDLDADPEPVGSAGIVSNGETVYASTTGLYVATIPWDWYHPVDGRQQQPESPPPTTIHAFSVGDGADVAYVASGEVPGRLLNQFAMSEHEGDLRVATTIDAGLGEQQQSESAVHVLRPDGDELRTISSIGGLGEGEQIHAVRFLGPTAYVVTFRQVDPLYVIDLRDPVAPVVRGELKIPGYSAYLHPVGDGLLLGVGQDATAEGRTIGTQLSLFDVSDPADPQRISTLPIGGWSEAEWDHHAFLHWPEDGTVVLPVSPGWGDCGPQVDCLASAIPASAGGAVVARIVDRSLVGVGTIAHVSDASTGCWNPLQRSLVIGDEIVTVGPDQMVFSDRADLERRADVGWGDPEEYGCWGYFE